MRILCFFSTKINNSHATRTTHITFPSSSTKFSDFPWTN